MNSQLTTNNSPITKIPTVTREVYDVSGADDIKIGEYGTQLVHIEELQLET